jgi:uncharacterized membrane protein YdjX (TVP38/TMEM64 family)/predicted transglutaminase-like cysteine proteinase
MPKAGPARSRRSSLIIAGIYIASLTLMAVWCLPYFTRLSDPAFQRETAAWAEQAGWKGWGLVVGLEILQIVVAPVPGGPVQVLAGVLYGAWGGLLACLAGCVIASCISFRIAEKFGAPLVRALLGEGLLARYGFLENGRRLETILFVLFLIPGVPKDMLTYFAGVIPVTLARFVFWTSLARVPGILASTMIGDAAQSGDCPVALLVLAAAAVAGFAGSRGRDAVLARGKKPGRPRGRSPHLVLLAVFLGLTNPIHAAAADTWDNVLGKRLKGPALNHAVWLKVAPAWQQVMEENARNPVFTEGGAAAFPPAYGEYWKNLLEAARNMDPLRKARLVSGFINTQFNGIQDKTVYGIGEKWASPGEFVHNRGGDCEDFAIIKYFALRSLGYPPEQLRILIVEVPSYKVWHALLALLTLDRVYIFDNNFRPHDLALPQSSQLAAFFKLHVAFNEDGAWYYE